MFEEYNNIFSIFQPVVKDQRVILESPLEEQDVTSWASRKITGDFGLDIPISKNKFSESTEPEEVIVQDENNSTITNEPVYNSKTITRQKALDNGRKVISLLMQRLKLTKQQAAGIAGVLMSESGLNPSSVNKAEKAGKLKSSRANGAGYGAGLLQWSNDRKSRALSLIGKNSPIETLSLEDQIEMLAKELEGPYRNTLEGIRKSNSASIAAATMYCHNTGGFSTSSLPATQNEISTMNKKYSKFGNPHVVNTGMDYAEQLLNYYSKHG